MVLRSLYSIYATCSSSIGFNRSNAKRLFLYMLRTSKCRIKEMLECAVFTSRDIFNFLSVLSKRDKVSSTFVYLDPPYSISKGRLDDNRGWDLDSLETLIIEIKKYNWQFAISEFNDSEVLDLLFKHNLYVNYIARSTGVASRFGHTKYEILGTSYKTNKSNITCQNAGCVQLEIFNA
uniref:DNA adenine methylase n=1 Tax=Borrelia miyamotoi TaxID=47466 RepID=A0A5P8AYH5_9SPIR|nr:hypothetical protein [Borrelia miyamotoi]